MPRSLQAPPGWAEIARAVPAGSAPLRSLWVERRFLDALVADERCRTLRADARETTIAVAKWLARHASWSDGTTRPGRRLVCKLVGAVRGNRKTLSVTAWKDARRRLEAWGYLGTVRPGYTETLRPMALRRGDPDEAPVYVLCLPRKTTPRQPAAPAPDTIRPLTRLNNPDRSPARERGGRNPEDQDGAGCAGAHPRAAAAARAPVGGSDAAAAVAAAVAEVMRKAAGQVITDRWCAWLWRPFEAAGWIVADVVYAIGHTPAGARHRNTDPVRRAVAWLRYRLGLWLDDAGAALLSHRQQLEERAAEARRRKRELDQINAGRGRTDARPHAARIRAQQGWT